MEEQVFDTSDQRIETERPVNKTVVCFDRDYTVSVNGAPLRTSVPLAWVKQLAHGEPGVDVWATGNQMLRNEATIHGVPYAGAVWESIYDESIEKVYPGERAEYYFPARDNRLRMVYDIYSAYHEYDQLRMIVVDDSDLSALEAEGWEYYTAWDFVDAALDGAFDEDLVAFGEQPGFGMSNVPDTHESVGYYHARHVSVPAPDVGLIEKMNYNDGDGDDGDDGYEGTSSDDSYVAVSEGDEDRYEGTIELSDAVRVNDST